MMTKVCITHTHTHQASSQTVTEDFWVLDVSHMIHIIDTEHPWDVFSINSGHTEVISCLEWDQSGETGTQHGIVVSCCVCLAVSLCVSEGSRLLSADGDGQIKCWSMSDHLVNSWESNLSSSVDGDPIVALSWLHNGVKLALHVEMVRNDSPPG